MSEVSPQSAQARRRAGARAGGILLGSAAEVVDVGGGHDGGELGMHSGFPSIDCNVESRMD
jgi:hypothetical protein